MVWPCDSQWVQQRCTVPLVKKISPHVRSECIILLNMVGMVNTLEQFEDPVMKGPTWVDHFARMLQLAG